MSGRENIWDDTMETAQCLTEIHLRIFCLAAIFFGASAQEPVQLAKITRMKDECITPYQNVKPQLATVRRKNKLRKLDHDRYHDIIYHSPDTSRLDHSAAPPAASFHVGSSP